MKASPRGYRIVNHPVLLGVALVGTVSLFVLGLSVSAFLLRDAPVGLGRPLPARPQVRSTAETQVRAARPPPGGLERQSASTLITPVFPRCYREARANDPSLANSVEIVATLDTSPRGGVLTSLRVGGGGSPFLAACLKQELVGATFPAGADGLGEVRWRARLDSDRTVLEEIAD